MDLHTLQQFEIRELMYFVAVAEELHFERAAERVGINVSWLSRAITKMEDKLGVRLFARTRKGTQLLPVGALLLPGARRTLAEAEQVGRILKAAVGGHRGRLRIALCENMTLPCVAELLRQSRLEAPDILLTVEQCELPKQLEQLEQLRAGLIDVGFTVSASEQPVGDGNDIDALPLCRDRIMVAMPVDHALAPRPIVLSLEDFGPFFVVGKRSGDMAGLESLIQRHDGRPELLELVDSLGLLLTRVALGDGLGLMSAQQAETVARADIAFRPLEAAKARFTTYLLTPRVDRSGPVARFSERARLFHLRPKLRA